jgi:integrase
VKHSRALHFAQWPAADQAAWMQAVRPAGLFEDAGLGAHWRTTTQRQRQRHYGYWLRFCEIAEIECPIGGSIADRATPETLAAYIDHLSTKISINAVATYVAAFSWAIRAMCPDRDWSWLMALVKRLERQITGPVVDKRPVLRDARVLVELGLDLMDEVDVSTLHELPGKALIRDRCKYRDGLLIALLTLRPLRKSTLAQIRVGHELQQSHGVWHLIFDRSQTKNGLPLEYVVPEVLLPYLTIYLAQVRPRFPQADRHEALWASNEGVPMTASGISKAVRRWTEQRLGVAISPHRFRDCAASTLVVRAPKQVRVAAPLLGHTTLQTTEQYYIQANALEAGRQYQHVLRDIAQRRGKRCR